MAVINHKCPSCNANLPYNPNTEKWDCEYCGCSYTLQELENAKNNDISALEKLDVYKCPDCGAQIIATETTSATFCIYCGNTTIIKDRLIDEFKPDAIIPFKMDKKNAIKTYKKSINKKMLLPSKFKKNSIIQKITGVYVPFWLYTCDGTSRLDVKARNISTQVNGNKKNITTREYQILRETSYEFERIPFDGLAKMENALLNSLEPFDYANLENFNISYLSGFLAEKYDTKNRAGTNEIKDRIRNTIDVKVKSTIKPYDLTDELSSRLYVNIQKIEYVLLPIWLLNIKFKNKTYLSAVNGQTGKCIADFPISKVKVAFCSILCFILVFLIYYGIMILFNMHYVNMTTEILHSSIFILFSIIPKIISLWTIIEMNRLDYNINKLHNTEKENKKQDVKIKNGYNVYTINRKKKKLKEINKVVDKILFFEITVLPMTTMFLPLINLATVQLAMTNERMIAMLTILFLDMLLSYFSKSRVQNWEENVNITKRR